MLVARAMRSSLNLMPRNSVAATMPGRPVKHLTRMYRKPVQQLSRRRALDFFPRAERVVLSNQRLFTILSLPRRHRKGGIPSPAAATMTTEEIVRADVARMAMLRAMQPRRRLMSVRKNFHLLPSLWYGPGLLIPRKACLCKIWCSFTKRKSTLFGARPR